MKRKFFKLLSFVDKLCMGWNPFVHVKEIRWYIHLMKRVSTPVDPLYVKKYLLEKGIGWISIPYFNTSKSRGSTSLTTTDLVHETVFRQFLSRVKRLKSFHSPSLCNGKKKNSLRVVGERENGRRGSSRTIYRRWRGRNQRVTLCVPRTDLIRVDFSPWDGPSRLGVGHEFSFFIYKP